ncbi:glycosyltransferase family 4 protein [Pedobacter polaris]|uniref:Glycosyltransferase family 4 protein n=1 Tax=Pedobacter polaris TaxID=2571273 RepID=A0A4U1CM72_9SPHI|nr:glycosyltransferase family 4 protein [Pedobacter polaris]TKC08179.1 glycosyltransferase family 4 protein [Pedobacter polaris]
MRIAVTADPFIPVPPINYGGIERIIHFLVEGLAKNGHDVILVAHKDSDVNVELIKYPYAENGTIGHLKNIMAVNQLGTWKPDVIHSFSRLAYLLPFLMTNIPKLMSYQREPTISQIQKALKFARKNTLSFTGCSDYISKQISPYAPSHTVYNGVDLSIYNFNSKVNDDAPLVFLGRIEPLKGTHNAVKVALATNKKLIIAGNIPNEHQGYFDKEVKPYLSEKIKYIGPVNDQQKNELLGNASAFLMPIEWNEPFGIVMAEALACGTPVIGYPKGAVLEVVEHGVNGYLANDFNELCEYVNNYSKILREKARESAEKRFSSNKIVNDYINIYHSLLNT